MGSIYLENISEHHIQQKHLEKKENETRLSPLNTPEVMIIFESWLYNVLTKKGMEYQGF